MRLDLSEYSKRIKQNVEKLNDFTTGSISIPIKQVAYRFNLDNDIMYLDYPYTDEVVNQNVKLKDPDSNIYGIDDRLFNYFKEDNSELKYIQYKFQYLNNKPVIRKIDSSISNFENTSILEDVRKAFSIIHYNSIIEDKNLVSASSYLDDVPYQYEASGENNDIHSLLFIFDKFDVDCALTRKNKSSFLNITFKLDENQDITREKTKKIIEHLTYNLKLFGETLLIRPLSLANRKSYILGFKHNLDNLYLKSEANALKRISTYLDSKHAEELLNISDKLKVTSLNHSFLFDYETIDFLGDDRLMKYDFAFKKKSINEVFEAFFDAKTKFREITVIEGNIQSYRMEPIDSKGNYMMSDICILVWNIWINACEASFKKNEKVLVILEEKENLFSIEISNNAILSEEMKYFICNDNDKHPKEEPNRPYRGWSIIKDIIKENRRISLKYNFDNSTTIKLIIKNENPIY